MNHDVVCNCCSGCCVLPRSFCWSWSSKGYRSAVESFRDLGTYIIHFKYHVTEEELKQFAAALSQSYDKRENFTAEIIEELFIIKCLTARLSGTALSWVRNNALF